jgi:hypothetical protein
LISIFFQQRRLIGFNFFFEYPVLYLRFFYDLFQLLFLVINLDYLIAHVNDLLFVVADRVAELFMKLWRKCFGSFLFEGAVEFLCQGFVVGETGFIGCDLLVHAFLCIVELFFIVFVFLLEAFLSFFG